MARYWNSGNLTITNLASDSTVGVWTVKDDGGIDIDNQIFVGPASDRIDINVPINTKVFVRVRKYCLRTFEMNVTTTEEDASVSVIQVR